MANCHVTTTINGDRVEYLCESQEPLLDVLRDRLGHENKFLTAKLH